MTVFRHVTRLNVSLWGQRVGTIVESPQRGVFAFRYDKGLAMRRRSSCFVAWRSTS